MSKKKLLVITASNGENLKLAERFLVEGKKLNYACELLDLTKSENHLPIFNPRDNSQDQALTNLKSINLQMESHSHWVICAPEYNGSIPPVFSSALAWLSVQESDFRNLFNGRPIAMATFSGGGGMELLLSMRIQLTHLGAQVVGRQLISNNNKPPKDESIEDLLERLIQMKGLNL